MKSPPPDPTPLPHSDACERNKGPILELLRREFAGCTHVLEIGSGTGQHAVHFATGLPWLTWQPSDIADSLPGLRRRIQLEGPKNLRAPVLLDVTARSWGVGAVDGVFSANTLHIMHWPQVEAMFANLPAVVQPGAVLAVYGPFRYGGKYTSESNASFDDCLHAQDPGSGIRDFEAVDALAEKAGFMLVADHRMPANNQMLVWQLSQPSLRPATAPGGSSWSATSRAR
ncbi:MAG: DUF938 domain-containing protein [Gammaproteobacteria bacterium]